MAGVAAARRFGLVVALLALALGSTRSVQAFEFFDGRLQVHGFFEEQIRGMGRDFRLSDDFDLVQWYHVLNVEVEYEVAPDGWGPFNLISTYARLEGRYDCIWTRGCGMLRSVDTYGDRARHLPKRVIDDRRGGFTGTVFTGDTRPYAGIPKDEFVGSDGPTNITSLDFAFKDERFGHTRRPIQFFGIPGIETLFGNKGIDGILGTDDDAAPFVFSPFEDCVFGRRAIKGRLDGREGQTLGPWNPGCRIQTIGALRGKPNPFNPNDRNPVLEANAPKDAGSTAQPFRPFPEKSIGGVAKPYESQGIFYPNRGLRRLIERGEFDSFDQNFRQAELEWNRGASQQDEKELKELYADVEFFDSRLWLRIGKQSIVWGKTELFRTTDQFNPQDLALATLPSLEESRIALWAVRGVWSFYDVGPLQDMRLELAFNYDQFEPADLGRCGEPFTANPACGKTWGLFAHGFAGLGAAGEIRPPDPWNGFKGIEPGARLEWRTGRFSFQLSDFYGYEDFPYQDRIFTYSRNVDPRTGRPRRLGSSGECIDGTEPACLGFASTDDANPSPAGNPFTDLVDADGNPGPDGNPDRYFNLAPTDPRFDPAFADCDPNDLEEDEGCFDIAVPEAHRLDAVREHSVNQQLFAMICSTSIAFSELDRSVCAQSVLTSKKNSDNQFRVMKLVGGLLAGSPLIVNIVGLPASPLVPGLNLPLVELNRDPRDDTPGSGARQVPPVGFDGAWNPASIYLTPEQEALLGCGPFYGNHCDDDGPDLLNAEASAFIQSWPGFDGTEGDWRIDNGFAQPGTVGFVGGSPCLHVEDGKVLILPGCRGPDYNPLTLLADYGIVVDPGSAYDPLIDGCSRDDGSPECLGKRTLTIPRSYDDAGVPIPVVDGGLDIDRNGIPGYDHDGDPATPEVEPFGASAGRVFTSEMAAVSWNAMMGFVALSGLGADDRSPINLFDPEDPLALDHCSFLKPQLCSNIQAVYSVIGVQRNDLRAGGNGRFGRRDFIWQGGGDVALRYERRNVLGFALDFAEDMTKSNWGAELTWIEGLRFSDNDQLDGISRASTYNLTVSADRPTFVNFLNPNRTFFINSQWFFQYVDGYEKGFNSNGPWNVLFTFTVQTGYSQDRLLPSVTWVYDFGSNSGGALAQVAYRFTENFSATFGMNNFWGRFEKRDMPISALSLDNRVGRNAYDSFVENGLSVVRDREELFLRIRYTF